MQRDKSQLIQETENYCEKIGATALVHVQNWKDDYYNFSSYLLKVQTKE